MALTDHDRLDGVAEAQSRGQALGVEVVGGCEVSCRTNQGVVHLLAYFVNAADHPFRRELSALQAERARRNSLLAAKLRELGIHVTTEELLLEARGPGLGRPHVAAVLERKGVVDSIDEAFDRYLAKGRPAYIERVRPDAARIIGAIRASGGVAVLAHPLSLHSDLDVVEPEVTSLMASGLSGLEAIYGRYTPDQRASLAALGQRLGLVVTGGSDYHGRYKPDLQVGVGRGDLHVPDEVLEELAGRIA